VFTKEDTTNLPPTAQRSNDKIHAILNTDKIHAILNNITIKEQIVKAKLSKLRADKATGVDDSSPKLLVEITNEISNPLTIFFQKMLQTGKVPEDFKLANVTPIYKKGFRSQPCNYRPISLTSQICRIFESILLDSIAAHLENNTLIRDSQHGFRRGRNCLTNLLIFLDKLTRLVDDGEDVGGSSLFRRVKSPKL